PSIATTCPPAVGPDTGPRALMNGGSSAASGSSSITIAGSLLLPSVPGGTGVAVDDPSPLTLGSSTLPLGGTGSMTGGGGSVVVDVAIVDEYVTPSVRVGGEVRRRRVERHVAAIEADGGTQAVAVQSLLAERRHVDADGSAEQAIVDADVEPAVRIAGDQVVR